MFTIDPGQRDVIEFNSTVAPSMDLASATGETSGERGSGGGGHASTTSATDIISATCGVMGSFALMIGAIVAWWKNR